MNRCCCRSEEGVGANLQLAVAVKHADAHAAGDGVGQGVGLHVQVIDVQLKIIHAGQQTEGVGLTMTDTGVGGVPERADRVVKIKDEGALQRAGAGGYQTLAAAGVDVEIRDAVIRIAEGTGAGDALRFGTHQHALPGSFLKIEPHACGMVVGMDGGAGLGAGKAALQHDAGSFIKQRTAEQQYPIAGGGDAPVLRPDGGDGIPHGGDGGCGVCCGKLRIQRLAAVGKRFVFLPPAKAQRTVLAQQPLERCQRKAAGGDLRKAVVIQPAGAQHAVRCVEIVHKPRDIAAAVAAQAEFFHHRPERAERGIRRKGVQ